MEDDLEKLQKVFGKVTSAETYYDVLASAKIYPNHVRVFIPSYPYQKKIPFMEEIVDGLEVEDWPSRIIDPNSEDNLERSVRKTKTLISDYVLCTEFDLFATFTFSPKKSDRFNPDLVKLQMASWLKNQKFRNGKFPYLIVPEFHADGKALHFHALFKGYTGELVDAGKTSKGRKLFHFKSYTLGFNSAVKIDNIDKVSSYVKKYITKDMPQFRGKRRFWSSHNLAKPILVDNPDDWYMHVKPKDVFENEYGKIFYIPISDKPVTDKDA